MPRSERPNPCNGWVDPRRPLTALISSDGIAGGVEAPTNIARHPRYGAIRTNRPQRVFVCDINVGLCYCSEIPSQIVQHHPQIVNPNFSAIEAHPSRILEQHSQIGNPNCSAVETPPSRVLQQHSQIGNPNCSPSEAPPSRVLQRHPSMTLSDDSDEVRGLVGGVETEDSSPESSPLPPFPFRMSGPTWEACVAEVDQWAKEHLRFVADYVELLLVCDGFNCVAYWCYD